MRRAWKLGLMAMVASPMLMGSMPLATAGRDGDTTRGRSNGVQVAALFGESDEEKAARQQKEDSQDLAIQALGQRVHDLEETLRQTTGQNEALAHRVQELSDKLDRQQKDFEYRLCAMQAQQLGATPGQPGSGGAEEALPCNPGGPAAPAGRPGQAQAAVAPPSPQLGRPPGTLGTLNDHDVMPPSQQGPDPQAQYKTALNLLAKGQNDEARADFRSFADSNPKDPLTPQAIYWIGRIAYVQKDFPGAAHAFVEEIKKYPTSPNAPESMVKLGESLIAMGQKKEGCTALAALRSKYPSASKSLVAKASTSRKAFCR